MARYDKYEPKGGGFRAPLAEDMTEGQVDTILGVGLDTNGRVVIGDGETGVVGVMVMPRMLKAREIADIMTAGDVVDLDGLNAGEVVHSAGDGTVSATDGAGTTRVGFVVGDFNGPRLVVRVGQGGAA